ncbi:MAG: RNA-guided endonuclease InsQ/TnpB family protein, partial [Pseudonocardiaceae bacterium]
RGPDRRTRQVPSNRWHKARARADRVHARVASLRRDAQHKLTSRLVAEFDTIAVEDLAVANMVRNRRLARRIADASWAEIRRQLTYKTERAGGVLIVADRWFASSKTCSGCGTAKAKLMLSERTYACLACGLVLDRDHNAALNLAALAVDTGQLDREQPAGTRVRHGSGRAVRLPREEPQAQRHCREAVAR